MQVIEQVPEGWAEEDKAWLETLPEDMRPVAVKHGRRLFVLVIQAGQIGEALNVAAATQQTNQAARFAATVVQQLVGDYLNLIGPDAMMNFNACKREVEQTLRQHAPRIVMPH